MTDRNQDKQPTEPQKGESERRRDRKFAVSSNRGKSSHRLRYVETGGAAVDTEDCTFCQVTPDLSGAADMDESQG